MATKSVMKDVKIRDRYLGSSLARALEDSRAGKTPTVVFQRTPNRVEKKDIKKFFGGDK